MLSFLNICLYISIVIQLYLIWLLISKIGFIFRTFTFFLLLTKLYLHILIGPCNILPIFINCLLFRFYLFIVGYLNLFIRWFCHNVVLLLGPWFKFLLLWRTLSTNLGNFFIGASSSLTSIGVLLLRLILLGNFHNDSTQADSIFVSCRDSQRRLFLFFISV